MSPILDVNMLVLEVVLEEVSEGHKSGLKDIWKEGERASINSLDTRFATRTYCLSPMSLRRQLPQAKRLHLCQCV